MVYINWVIISNRNKKDTFYLNYSTYTLIIIGNNIQKCIYISVIEKYHMKIYLHKYQNIYSLHVSESDEDP